MSRRREKAGPKPADRSAATLVSVARKAIQKNDLKLAASLLKEATTKAREEADLASEACARALNAALLAVSKKSAARAEGDEALRLARLANSILAEVEALFALGLCAEGERKWDEASRHYERALPLAERHLEPMRARMIRSRLATIAIFASDMGKASTHVATLVAGADAPDADGHHAWAILAQGEIANRLGKFAEAKQLYDEARVLFHRLEDLGGEALALMSLGDMLMYENNFDVAEGYIQAATETFQRTGSLKGEANCLQSLGEIAYRRGDCAKAREIFTRTLALCRQSGERQAEGNAIVKLGDLAREPPVDEDVARQHFAEALKIFTENGDRFSMGRALRRLAEVAETVEEAVAYWTEAASVFKAASRPDLVQEVERDMKAELEAPEESTDGTPATR
jgi:tetratricopeptide (TPR) repeat protein